MTVTLTLAAPCDPLNSNQRLNRYVTAARVKQWRARAHVAVIQAGRPKLDRAHVTAVISHTTNRRRDALNWWPTVKAAIDGAVEAGLLPDDSDAYVVGPDLRPGDKADVFTVALTFDPDCECRDCAHRFGPRLKVITNGGTK